MPQYGKSHSISIFPQQSGYAIGYPAIPGADAVNSPGLAVDQYESISTGFKSVPISPSLMGQSRGYTQRQVSWESIFGTPPSACSLILQGALEDVEASYQTVDTSTNAAGEVRTVDTNMRFFRILADSVTGACTAIVKIALM